MLMRNGIALRKRYIFRRQACALLLLLASPTIVGMTGRTTNWEIRVLASQNMERSSLGLSPLDWDATLAGSAQQWAGYLARTGRFEHSRDNASHSEGENLWAGSKGYYTPEAMTGAWIAEKRHFILGIFPDNSDTGNVEDVGHYTQLVWRSSKRIGCALAEGSSEDFLVCRYSDAGNWVGDRPY